MTRKRFIKLVMADSLYDRNTALKFANLSQILHKSYEVIYWDMWYSGVM